MAQLGAMDKLRVLLVDDNQQFLDSTTGFLSDHEGIKIVGQASSATEAIRLAQELSPDLVLMDIAMPQINGLEATLRIKAQPAAPRVIILTLYDYPEYRAQASRAGADGFLGKAEFGTELLPMIQALFPKSAA